MKLKKQVKKNIKRLSIVIIFIGLIITTYKLTNKNNDVNMNKIEKMMKEYNIDKKDYSKTLEYVLLNNIYNEKYLKEYEDIEFINKDNFGTILNTFLPKGYSGKEINYILKLSNKNIDYLSNINYQNISKYYSYKNFDASKIERYNNYQDNNLNIKDIITRVNLNLDLEVYTDTNEVINPDDLLVVVNKYNHLPKSYKPNDLVNIDGAYNNQVQVRKILKEPFKKLQEDALKNGIKLMPTTAFRSETFQKTLYDNYVSKDGIKKADTYSARPGYSEHQTGLAIDLKNMDLGSNIRLTDENYEWLSNNAYKYGFIIRFPEEKIDITQYQFENWHIRYVGLEHAKIIYENKLSLEEYIDLYIKEY